MCFFLKDAQLMKSAVSKIARQEMHNNIWKH